MHRLARMIGAAAPGTAVQFRLDPYGADDIGRFLRDVLALAKAEVDGPRYLAVGIEVGRQFRKLISAGRVEVGFPGDIIHKILHIPTDDLAALPSAVAGRKLSELLDAHQLVADAGSNTLVARLTHARLFGSDRPYEFRSPDELRQELAEIKRRYRDDDAYFLFEQHARRLPIVVRNQGDDALHDASLALALPGHDSLHVADRMPPLRIGDEFVERSAAEQSDYPAVTLRQESMLVTSSPGEIPRDGLASAFAEPLRVCIGHGLHGRRLGIRYTLEAANLRRSVKGTLRLQF